MKTQKCYVVYQGGAFREEYFVKGTPGNVTTSPDVYAAHRHTRASAYDRRNTLGAAWTVKPVTLERDPK